MAMGCRPLHVYTSDERAEVCAAGPFSLRRIRISRAGYEIGYPGTYWGHGAPLYLAESYCGSVYFYLRADDRTDAKAQVSARYPRVRFHR